MIAWLELVLSVTLVISIITAFIFIARDKDAGVGVGCLSTSLVLFVWGVVFVARLIIMGIETGLPELASRDPRFSSILYVIALGVGNLLVLFSILNARYKEKQSSYSSPSMSDKARIYDSDGKVIGYFDRDDGD